MNKNKNFELRCDVIELNNIDILLSSLPENVYDDDEGNESTVE